MKKGLTERGFILDRSGSMGGLESDTIGGFNAMLRKQKAVEGDALVTTVLFSDEYRLLHDRIAIRGVAEITDREYTVGGCTALLDAVGRTIDKIGNAHRNTDGAERPEHTVFVITTDGLENASREYSRQHVRQLISRKQEKDGWEFIFLGANIDAIAAAGEIGIHADHAARFVNDGIGTQANYSAVSHALERVRACAPLSREWKAEIEEDYATRGKPSASSRL